MDAFAFNQLLSEAITSALKPRLSRILHLRLGLIDGKPRTLEEIGLDLGVTRERVRQLLLKAQPSLRRHCVKDSSARIDSASAQLFDYLRVAVRVSSEDLIPVVFRFCDKHLPTLPVDRYAGPLLAYLLFSRTSLVEQLIDAIREYQRDLTTQVRRLRRQAARERALVRLQQRFDRLQAFTIATDFAPDLDALRQLGPSRAINRASSGKAGEFFSEKLGRKVEYESESERRFIERLELLDSIEWYVEQPLSIDYRCSILDITRHYHPDLLFIGRNGRATVVEIKPVFHMALRHNLDKWGAARRTLRKMGIGFLVTDGQVCVQELLQHQVPAAFRASVLGRLDRGDLDWPQYRKAVAHLAPTVKDFAGLVLQEKLNWTMGPFQLKHGR